MSMPLADRQVVLGVTGGIAAYKAPEIVRRLRKLGATVSVILTAHAEKFVTRLTFEALSGRPVVTDMFESPAAWEVEHIALAKRAELFLIAPATANVLAKMAAGIADDMLTSTVLATRAPLLLAPAMNTGMWENAATRANMRTLTARGAHFVGPETGMLANGDSGAGRMAEPDAIVDAATALLCPRRDLAGLRVLVTAGPTREPLDPVRYMTNRSSGKMGYALAEAARARGAEVTLVSGPVSIVPPSGVRLLRVETTQQLYDAMLSECDAQDVIVQAAAPADFRPASVAAQKIKKQGDAGLTLHLVENPDVAAAVGARKHAGQLLVGFAAETEQTEAHAREKLARKHLDLIVANDVTQPGAGFDVDTNIVTLLTKDGLVRLPQKSKRAVADDIWDAVCALQQPNATPIA